MTTIRKKFKNILLKKQVEELNSYVIAYRSNKDLNGWKVLKLNKNFFQELNLPVQSGSLNLFIPLINFNNLNEFEKNNIIPLFYFNKNEIFLLTQMQLANEYNIINNFLKIQLLYKKLYLYCKVYAQLKL